MPELSGQVSMDVVGRFDVSHTPDLGGCLANTLLQIAFVTYSTTLTSSMFSIQQLL